MIRLLRVKIVVGSLPGPPVKYKWTTHSAMSSPIPMVMYLSLAVLMMPQDAWQLLPHLQSFPGSKDMIGMSRSAIGVTSIWVGFFGVIAIGFLDLYWTN